jgi:hypothetical protein
MAESTVRLINGSRWTSRDFLDHYFKPTASGVPAPVAGPPEPVDVDRSWYMGDEGPGRYYHPGMFPIINQIMANRNLAPGSYNLQDFVPNRNEKDPLLAAGLSNYTTDMHSGDHWLRSLVFGNESARISGQVMVNPDGSKTFKQIEIRPLDTNFDFDHNTNNMLLEGAREIARRVYDPDSLGASYNIQYRGPGPDNGSGREFVRPGSGPPGLLPSVTGKPPLPYVDEHRQYLDQVNGNSPQTSATDAPNADGTISGSPNTSDSGAPSWIASLAGVNPANPTQPASSPLNDGVSDFYRNDPAWLLQLRR